MNTPERLAINQRCTELEQRINQLERRLKQLERPLDLLVKRALEEAEAERAINALEALAGAK